jgi:hypothetical protein
MAVRYGSERPWRWSVRGERDVTYTRDAAARAVAEATAERDAIQSNLLDLDNSLGIRLLKGTMLTGVSKTRWDAASSELATLWDLYAAYSAIISEAAGSRDLARITTLMTGPSVQVTRGPRPLAERDLADTGTDRLTLAAARTRMRAQFADIAALAAATEKAWNDAAAQLEVVASDLARTDPSGDDALTAEAAAVRRELGGLRDALNADPLGIAPGPAAALAERAAGLAARAAEVAAVRDNADARIAAAGRAAATARAGHADAVAAAERAAVKVIVRDQVPPFTDPSPRLAAVADLRAAGRWTRLAADLDALDRDLAAAIAQFKDAERRMAGLLASRDELRGLLGAYKAKAARLGAIEDLATLYDAARELLWTAPCDLDVAEQAVQRYQHEVLTRGARR